MGKSGKLLKTLAQGVRAFKSPSKDQPSKEQSPSKKTQKQGREHSRRGGKDKCLWSLGKSSSRCNRETVPSPSSASLDAVDIKVVHEEQQRPTSDDAYHPTDAPIHDKPAMDIKVPGDTIDVEGISSIDSFAEASPEKDSTELAKECAQEEWAAANVQAGSRHYQAQHDFQVLRALIRIQALARGRIVRRQAAITLRCVQAVVRMQALVRGRQARMSEIGQIVQRHLQRRREDTVKLGLSTKQPLQVIGKDEGEPSKTQQALTHAFSEQLRRCAPKQSSLVIDPATSENHWGWMWLERWMAARPWENPSPSEGERPYMMHVARAIDENVQSQTEAWSGTTAKGAEKTISTVAMGTPCPPIKNMASANPLAVEEPFPAYVTEKGIITENTPPFPQPEGTSFTRTALKKLVMSPSPPPPPPEPVPPQPPLSASLLPETLKTTSPPLSPFTAPLSPPPAAPAPMLSHVLLSSTEGQLDSPVGTLEASEEDNQAYGLIPVSPSLDSSQLEISAPPITTSLSSSAVPSEEESCYRQGIHPPLQSPDHALKEASNGFSQESTSSMNGENMIHPDHTLEEAANGCGGKESMSCITRTNRIHPSMKGENRAHPDHTLEQAANVCGGEESASSMGGEHRTQAAEAVSSTMVGNGEEIQLGKESSTKAPASAQPKPNGKGVSSSSAIAASQRAVGASIARRLSSPAMAMKPQQEQQGGEVCALPSPAVPNYMATTQSSKAKMRSMGAGGSPKQNADSPKQKLGDSPSSSASKRRHSLPGAEGKGSPVAKQKHSVAHVRAGSRGHLAALRDGSAEDSPRSVGEFRHGAPK